MNPQPNPGKNLVIEVDGVKYERYPIKTPVIKKNDDLITIIRECAGPFLRANDLIFVSEKIVAISQGRSFHIDDIKVTPLARYLSGKVYKSPYGIGLGSPWTMQLALDEVGYTRIFAGILVHLICKPFGLKGMFYHVVGRTVAAIDGPCDYTIPPYNKYAKLGPKNPHKVAREFKTALNHDIVIIDANDLGVNILGTSTKAIPTEVLAGIFKDNPLGQTNEQTPVCIVRPLTS